MQIDLFRKGDGQAFKSIFTRYYKPLCSYVYRHVNDVADTDDIVQEVFLNLWNRRAGFESEKKIESFLFVAARNACLNNVVHKQFCQMKLEEYVQEVAYDEWEDTLLKDEFDKYLSRWLAALPSECRRVIEMSLSGKKSQEIATELHLAVSTVKNQKVKGLKKLRELCQQEYILFFVEWLLLR